MIKIIHEKPKCIGCGACVSIAPDFWELSEGKATLKGSKKEGENEVLVLDDLKGNDEAANICPVNCIHIEKDGKKLI